MEERGDSLLQKIDRKYRWGRTIFYKYIDLLYNITVGITILYGLLPLILENVPYLDTVQSSNIMKIATLIFIGDLFLLGFVYAKRNKNAVTVCSLKRDINGYQQQILDLNTENKESIENVKEDIIKYIQYFAINRLEFDNIGEYEDRITLYVHDDTAGAFILFYRFSKNPSLQTKGRPFYEDNLGVIGKAWQQGIGFRDYDHDYREEPEEYLKEVVRKDPDLNEQMIVNLTMKPRQVIALRLDQGVDKYYGMIVIESYIPKRFNKEQILTMFNTCAHTKDRLPQKLETVISKFNKTSRVDQG